MIQWDEKYSVGVQSIDNQHMELFNLLNNLLEAMKQGRAAHVLNSIILDLERYAVNHFKKEEYFFHRFNYADKDKHIEEHQLFTQKITQLKSDLKSGKITVTFELFNFLKDWTSHHILEIDKKYLECFRENGLR